MKGVLSALASGLVFGFGLGISGMTLPSKVIGFLQWGSEWDPSLALVMVGAIAVHAVFAYWISLRKAPLWAESFRLPTRSDVTPKLVAGSALFGIGWAVAGYCPGPGLVSLGGFTVSGVLFTAALIVGMRGYDIVARALSPQTTTVSPAPIP